jgi:hypothetical protein
MTWTNIVLVISALLVILLLARWHADKRNPYDVRDLLMDHTTGKAGIDKHILLWFAGLSGWVVVSRQLAGKDVETLLLGVLGIFILQRAASKAMDTFGPRPDGGGEPRDLERK